MPTDCQIPLDSSRNRLQVRESNGTEYRPSVGQRMDGGVYVRKIPDNLQKVEYIDGFLSKAASEHGLPSYGYHKNHLPETSGNSRMIPSSFDLIKRQHPAK